MLRSILTGKLILLSCVVLLSSVALAQFRTVTVQNAPSNPVPTTIQNPGPIPTTIQNTDPIATTVSGVLNANIVNGNVPVTVTNTTNTNITNVPTVSINGTIPVTLTGTTNTNIVNVPTVSVNGTVPVVVTGTANANIVNVPTVNVNGTVPVTGSVGITGTPNVSVTNLPLGTVGPTTVLLVKDLASTTILAPEPFQRSLSCATSPGPGGSCTANISVPAGKQLVIEYLQVVSSGNVGNGMHHFEVQTTAGGQAQTYLYAPGGKVLSDTASDDRVVRIYADPGSTVQLTGVQGMAGPGVTFNLLLSGHLVNTQ